jgi:hypothetical protein
MISEFPGYSQRRYRRLQHVKLLGTRLKYFTDIQGFTESRHVTTSCIYDSDWKCFLSDYFSLKNYEIINLLKILKKNCGNIMYMFTTKHKSQSKRVRKKIVWEILLPLILSILALWNHHIYSYTSRYIFWVNNAMHI